MRNGQIVIDPNERLPEGPEARIEVLAPAKAPSPVERTLSQRLLKHAGKAKGLPRDASRNHDHYLYGTPKR